MSLVFHMTYEEAADLFPQGVPDVYCEHPTTLDQAFFERLSLWMSARAAVQRMRYHIDSKERTIHGLCAQFTVVDEAHDLQFGAPKP